MQHPVVHVIFTDDGLPRWFGSEPVRDSEPLDLEELRHLLPADALEDALAVAWQSILITHRRVGGTWALRDVGVAGEESPDPAELAYPEPPLDVDPATANVDVGE